MSQPFNEKKYQNLFNFTYNITLIFFRFILFVGIVTILAFIVLLFIPKSAFNFDVSQIDMQMDFGNAFRYQLDFQLKDSESLKLIGQLGLFVVTFYLAVLSFILYHLKNILLDVKKANPFSIANIKSLFTIAYAFIAYSIIGPVIEFIVASILIHKLNIDVLDASLGINMPMVFIGLLLLILASIFKYGAYLQDEYNQTV